MKILGLVIILAGLVFAIWLHDRVLICINIAFVSAYATFLLGKAHINFKE